MERLRVLRLLFLFGVLVSSGCGGASAGHFSPNCSPKHVSVAVARSEQPKQLVGVEGHYVRRNGVTRICDEVITSGSPTCAGESLVVRRYEPGPQVTVDHANGVVWTSGNVRIFGLVSGTTLQVTGCV